MHPSIFLRSCGVSAYSRGAGNVSYRASCLDVYKFSQGTRRRRSAACAASLLKYWIIAARGLTNRHHTHTHSHTNRVQYIDCSTAALCSIHTHWSLFVESLMHTHTRSAELCDSKLRSGREDSTPLGYVVKYTWTSICLVCVYFPSLCCTHSEVYMGD